MTAFTLMLTIGSAHVRADLFWDSNGANSGGSDTAAAPGTWGADSFWSVDPNGLAGTGAWVVDETAVFSADVNVTDVYDVTVSGTQSASGIRVEEGTVTFNGGTITLANAATIDVGTGLTTTIGSVISGSSGLTKSGASALVLAGANNYSGNTVLAANATASPLNTLRLGASEVIPDTSVVQFLGANSIFELNGQTETVKSLTGGGTGSRVDVGTGTLILDDLTGEVSTFSSQVISSSTGKIIKNGGGQFNLAASSGSWDGELVLNDGILGFGVNNALGSTASGTAKLTLNGGTITASGNLATSRSIQTQQVDITSSFAALIHTANFQLLGTGINGGDEGTVAITLKVDNPTITVNNSTGGTGVLIFTGPVGDEGQNRGFTKAGSGALTLNSSSNSFGGDITILAGQVRIDANATLGDGTGTVHLAGGNLATTRHRDPVTNPIVNPINMTADAVISTTRQLVDPSDSIEVDFTSNSITATAGTLTFRNDATGTTNPDNQFEPRFSGSGFNFGRPIVIAAGLNDPVLRTTRLSSANATGTQTFSGEISGPGKFRRMVDGGTTILTAANTYSGGTEVEGGTLTVSGASATLGTGAVTVTGGILSIAAGVANAIADAASLSISGTGKVDLGAGINDMVAALSLGGVAQTNFGTYGSTASNATFKNDTFFSGLGVINFAAPTVDDADFDADGDVDGSDFLTWQRGLGLSGAAATLAAGNANGDAVVDGSDLTVWRSQFGVPAVPAVGTVPEPTAAMLAIAAIVGLAARRSRREQGNGLDEV